MNDMNIGNFKVISKLGAGSFGDVFEIEKDGKKYALKVIENVGPEGIKSLRELDIMGRLIHPNLMHAEQIVVDFLPQTNFSKIGILMEKADTDLHRAMHNINLKLVDRYKVLNQIVLGVKSLHDSGYLHLDLKPLNVLLFKNIAKITDFGLAILTENVGGIRSKYYPVELCTIDHRSYNILNGDRNYTAADDVWSLGIIFLEVLSGGKSLFGGFKQKDFTEAKVKNIYEEYLSKDKIDKTLKIFLGDQTEAISIVKKMLDFEPHKRATISEVLNSPVFKKKSEPLKLEPLKFKPVIIENPNCDLISYEGFDLLFRMATQMTIRLETFFLAVDIYQRSLAYRNPSQDFDENYRNISYQAALALYMAIKMNESYFADADLLAKLSGNIFKPYKLLLGESVLINNWKGILYPNNLFRSSTTERRLIEAVELSRNCFLYRTIDLDKWRDFSEEEEKYEGKFNKYIYFQDFIGRTPYYHQVISPSMSYIRENYEKDKRSVIGK